MNLSSLRKRIDHLLEQQGPPIGPPSAVFLLPDNGRGPDAEKALPRVAWRNAKAVCILFDVEAGQPGAAEIDRLVEAAS